MPTGKGPVRIAIEDFFDTFGFGKRVQGWVTSFIETLEDEGLNVYGDIVGHFDVSKYIPANLQPGSIRNMSRRAPVQIVPILAAIGGIVIGIFAGAMQPIARLVSYQVEKLAKSYRIDPMVLIAAKRRNAGLANDIKTQAEDLGVSDEAWNILDVASQQLLTPELLVIQKRRGHISDATFYQRMAELGITNIRASEYLQATEVIPGVQDLITIAVREGFNDAAAQRFGYDEEYPSDAGAWAEKQGLPAEWVKRYWRAHWQLPSPQQAFEMFQRLRPGRTSNVVDESDLALYLKTADFPAFWRERLKEIAYLPLTRVDVRRMFGVGVLTADEVYQAYRDLGYDDKNAKRLADFTVKIEKAEEKGLTRSAIQDGYQSGVWTRAQASEALNKIGYSAEESEFWLDLVDNAMQQKQINLMLDAIQAKYVSGLLDDQTVYTELGPLNLPSERVTALLELWNVQKYNRVSTPSRSDLDDFFRRGLIDEGQYATGLKRDGFDAASIDLYSRRITAIVAEDARLTAQDQQTEQERVQKAQFATDYQKAVADINVQLADIDVNIADLQLAIYDMTVQADITDAKRTILQLKEQKKLLLSDKAKLKVDLVNKSAG